MPYTPPCQSPAASPAQSRSASISLHDRPSNVTLTTNTPPRSSSYLRNHHRRSSNTSTSRPQISRQLSPSSRSGSLHQSPAPVNNSSFIPTGAIVSPPESGTDDDEADEPLEMRRGRQIDSKNLDELKEAIKILPQRRVPSPDNSAKRNSPADLASTSPRKFGHHRATSDSSFLKHFNKSNPDSDVEDEGYRIAPPMVRKKSGELVKSSLKTPNRSRPSSVPSTPTFPKAVHFDSHLEHVRHFLNTEKPTAVSAGSSPVESFDGDEFPFDGEDEYQLSPPFEWEIELPNFPKDPNSRKHLPVRLERAYLSADKQNLLGAVAVHNISFQKKVIVRFTLDYWQTVSEVTAEYNSDVRKKERGENTDRFTFKIKLHDLANLETKTLFFCIRYCVGGQELWDNNNDMNFQVDFKKKYLPQNGKPGRVALPRSRPAASTLARKVPSLDKFDAFDDLESLTIQVDKPVPRQSVLISEGTEPVRRANPSGNAFSNRYDFTASLSAAIAGNTSSPRMGVLEKDDPVVSKPEENPYFKFTSGESVPKSNELPLASPVSALATQAPKAALTTPPQSPSSTGARPLEVIEKSSIGEKPSIGSLSYRELLETYCFFGSARGSPQLNQVTLEETPVKDIYPADRTTLLSAYTLGSHSPSPPTSLNNSPLPDGQSPRYTPPNGSPPSLSGSQRSSATSSPVPFGYKYQPRRNHGGFAFDTPQATAIRG